MASEGRVSPQRHTPVSSPQVYLLIQWLFCRWGLSVDRRRNHHSSRIIIWGQCRTPTIWKVAPNSVVCLFVCFVIITGPPKVAKIVHRDLCTFTHFPQMVTFYITIVQYQNQEIDIGTMHKVFLKASQGSHKTEWKLSRSCIIYIYPPWIFYYISNCSWFKK